jgi:rubrerythrin
MSNSTNQPSPAGTPHEHDTPEEESSCLQWRCRKCGAACLGMLADKPARCPSCGATDLEFVSED